MAAAVCFSPYAHPSFQDYEVGSGITLLSATHNGKAGYADVILYFGIGVEQSVYLFPPPLACAPGSMQVEVAQQRGNIRRLLPV